MNDGIRDYIDARLDGVEREIRSLEKSTDSRFRDAETTRNEGLNRVLNLLRDSILQLETRISEKFVERDKALEKAASVMDERMTQVYSFRDQINSERMSYVTRDQLADTTKTTMNEVDILKRAVTLSAGKETGVSKTWAIVLSILSAASGAIVAAGVFLRH